MYCTFVSWHQNTWVGLGTSEFCGCAALCSVTLSCPVVAGRWVWPLEHQRTRRLLGRRVQPWPHQASSQTQAFLLAAGEFAVLTVLISGLVHTEI